MSTFKEGDVNLFELILDQAQQFPDRTALILPDLSQTDTFSIEESLSYEALMGRVFQCIEVLKSQQIQAKDRVVLLVRLHRDTIAMLLALMAIGAIPVLINAGLPLRKFIHSLRLVQAKLLVAEPSALRKLRWLPPVWGIPQKASLLESSRKYPCLGKMADQAKGKEVPIFSPTADHPALISFTSGSSGMPKGVIRTHEILIQQHLALKAHFPPPELQIDMPGFPVVTLHNLCCGATTVIPHMDFSQVDQADPSLILQQMQATQVNTLSGSPAYLGRLTTHCLEKGIVLDHIYGLVTGGAPISQAFCRELRQVFPNALLRVNYGSSEAEPIAAIDADEWVNMEAKEGQGYCVGEQAEQVQLRIRPNIPGAKEGEVLVAGPHICRAYFRNPTANQQYKLHESGLVWHRTGDIGYLDEQQRLWLTGRQENVIHYQGKEIYPFSLERKINALPGVERSAVICNKRGKVKVFLTGQSSPEWEAWIQEILEQAGLPLHQIKLLKQFPLDARHRAKIEYGKLK